MKVLITGGLGYLGGRLAEQLAPVPGMQLVLTTRGDARSAAWAPGATVESLDGRDLPRMTALCSGADVVFHLAGMNAADARREPDAALEARRRDVSVLLESLRLQPATRLIYVSTAHVYGPSLSGRVDESTALRPAHPYAASHLAAEQQVREARQRGTIDGVVVRLSNSFGAPAGPGGDGWSLAVNDLCRQAVTTRRMMLRTTGRQRRDFIPMSEACRALQLLGAAKLPADDATFNVGSGDATPLAAMAARIAARVELRLGFRPELQLGASEDAVGLDEFHFDSARLRALGFRRDPSAEERELDRLIDACSGQGARP